MARTEDLCLNVCRMGDVVRDEPTQKEGKNLNTKGSYILLKGVDFILNLQCLFSFLSIL